MTNVTISFAGITELPYRIFSVSKDLCFQGTQDICKPHLWSLDALSIPGYLLVVVVLLALLHPV